MELSFDTERLPLAARLRPRTLNEFFGQEQIVGPGRLLRRAIQADQLSSLILSGPPGTGKTTLARVIAARTRSRFLTINAVLSGVKDIRESIQLAQSYRAATNRQTILFVDEVHRWNKSQQDALLPWVENGLFILIGATTENPFFEVNRALLSRSRVFLLSPLTPDDLEGILDFALHDRERGYGEYRVTITDPAREHLVKTAGGDARTLLNALELAVETSGSTFPPPPDEAITIDLAVAEDSIQQRAVLYDKDGDYHFDTISAFIKSVRGSDPDASLYWLAKMIEAGEDPRYIFRRLLVSASEDIGLADPHALGVVVSCADAFDRVGMPEGRFHLTQATLYLANTEKSNSTLGVFDAITVVRDAADGDVPAHLRDAKRDGADLGHGKGYLYPHAYTDHWVAQKYLPSGLEGRLFYRPGVLGWEGERQGIITRRRLRQFALEEDERNETWSVAPGRDVTRRWTDRTKRGGTDPASDFLEGLSFSPTDRVLLAGDGVGVLVYPVFQSTGAGITSVWTIPTIADSIACTIGTMKSRIDAPDVHTIGAVPDDAYHGPFDTVILRLLVPGEPQTILSEYRPVLSPSGILRCIDTDILAGDRPSTLLGPYLSDEALDRLSAAERVVFPDTRARWEEIRAAENEGAEETGAPWTFATVERTVARSLDRSVIAAWLGPETPLGAELRRSSSTEIIETVKNATAAVEAGERPWKRVYIVVTIKSSRA